LVVIPTHGVFEIADLDQAHDERGAVVAFARPSQFVNRAPGIAAGDDVFEVVQTAEMHAQLSIAPAGRLSRLTAGEAHHLPKQAQEAAGLRWKLVQGASRHGVRQSVGDGDVVQRQLDVGTGS
jgi:hypothetical protein